VEYLTLDDGIEVDEDTIKKAKKNDGKASFSIGVKYHQTEKDYSKAMTWYRLAESQKYSFASNNIGVLYCEGLGYLETMISHWIIISRELEIIMMPLWEILDHDFYLDKVYLLINTKH
jgi:TPR repeat protein